MCFLASFHYDATSFHLFFTLLIVLGRPAVCKTHIRGLNSCQAFVGEKLLNLKPLQRANGLPRFSTSHESVIYSFNPCVSYNEPLDPHAGLGDGCHYVAVCKVVSSQGSHTAKDKGIGNKSGRMDSVSSDESDEDEDDEDDDDEDDDNTSDDDDSDFEDDVIFEETTGFQSIALTGVTLDYNDTETTDVPTRTPYIRYYYGVGLQRTAKFKFLKNELNSKQLELQFRGSRSSRKQTSHVHLVCEPHLQGLHDALFTVIHSVGLSVHFELRHKCCCLDGCPFNTTLSHVVNTTVNASVNFRAGLSKMALLANPAHLWLVLVVNLCLIVVALSIGALCLSKGRVGASYISLLPGVHASGESMEDIDGVGVETFRYRAPERLEYSTKAERKKQLPILSNCVIPATELKISQRLGGGLFGDTYMAHWRHITVAAKRFTVGIHQSQLNPNDYKWLEREINFLSKHRHKNIVFLLGVCFETRQPYLVNEYMECESVKQILMRGRAELTWLQKAKICQQAADGMTFLHSAIPPILHRDLRCANLLMDSDEKVKIADYGVMKMLQKLRQECSIKDCYCKKEQSALPALIRWSAPEVLSFPDVDSSSADIINTSVDVYSFSILMWEIIVGTDPYNDISDEEEVMALVKDGIRPYYPTMPETLSRWLELIILGWDSDPEKRPTFKQISHDLKDVCHSAKSVQKLLDGGNAAVVFLSTNSMSGRVVGEMPASTLRLSTTSISKLSLSSVPSLYKWRRPSNSSSVKTA